MQRPSKPCLIKLVLLAGGVALAARLVTVKKGEWKGLAESEVREKLNERMPDRVPEDKRVAVADKVVATMQARGLLTEAAAPADEEVGGADDAEAVEEHTDEDEPSQ